jgi:hypothetical protein
MKRFFTRRRKGAKEKIEPKHPRFVGYAVDDAVNAVLDQVLADEAKNLSAFAPLRETFDPTRITDIRRQAGP